MSQTFERRTAAALTGLEKLAASLSQKLQLLGQSRSLRTDINSLTKLPEMAYLQRLLAQPEAKTRFPEGFIPLDLKIEQSRLTTFPRTAQEASWIDLAVTTSGTKVLSSIIEPFPKLHFRCFNKSLSLMQVFSQHGVTSEKVHDALCRKFREVAQA